MRRAVIQTIRKIEDIEFEIIYSRRRTLGISVLRDSSVIVRVPYKTTDAAVERIVRKKYSWIIKHRDNFLSQQGEKQVRVFANGGKHLFRGNECVLMIERSSRPFIRFNNSSIEMGLKDPDDTAAVRSLLYSGYRKEAGKIYPQMMMNSLERYKEQGFRPSALVIRSMRRRWGSCSGKGIITLSTELVKLPEIYTEYVIAHELCHLRHHNHGEQYYRLLSELFPEWKKARNEMKKFIM